MKTLIVTLLAVVSAHAQNSSSPLIQSSEPFTSNATIRLKPDPLCASMRDTERESITALENLVRLKGDTAIATPSTTRAKALKSCAERGPLKVEEGLLNGVAFHFYYSDGSGTFAGDASNSTKYGDGVWMVGCEKDAITDEKSCYLDRGDLRVWADGRGRSEIYVGSNHYPGSAVIIRIDRSAPLAINSSRFNGSFGYRTSPAIIQRVASAKTITTRYQKWPYTDYEDQTLSTYGFKEALAYIRWAVRHVR
ncbi:MAG: hypothetical protein ACR2HX_19710 [Pyrinomonadaceae bacterium]